MKKTLIACTLSLISLSAFAQSTPPETGFLVDSSNHAVRSSDGNCVRTGSYDPATAYHPDCNPIKPIAVAPAVVVPVAPPVAVAEKQTQVNTVRVNFNFDSSKLTAEAKTKIDTFLANNSVSKGQVKIEAGTDFIGTEKYNEKLSVARANAVADYVKTKSGVTVTDVVGLGETTAKLQNTEDCKNIHHNHTKLIKCVADDRFATVTLTIK